MEDLILKTPLNTDEILLLEQAYIRFNRALGRQYYFYNNSRSQLKSNPDTSLQMLFSPFLQLYILRLLAHQNNSEGKWNL